VAATQPSYNISYYFWLSHYCLWTAFWYFRYRIDLFCTWWK